MEVDQLGVKPMAMVTTFPKRGFLRVGIGAAVAALTALGATQPATAGTTAPSRVLKTYTGDYAGYVSADNALFRFITSTLKVPVCLPDVADTGIANVALQGGAGGTNVGAEVTVHCGGGSGSVGYEYGNSGLGRFRLSPKAGDVLTISVYYDQVHHYDHFAVTDATQRITRTVAVAVSRQVFVQAVLGARFPYENVRRPPKDTRVWEFTDSHLTSYSGIRGSITGPWGTWQVIDTTNGTPAGAIVADAPVLWNRDQNFGVWLRAHG